jgi:hypothetical protein
VSEGLRPTAPPAALESQPTRNCDRCGDVPYLVRSLLDTHIGKTIRMFECVCGQRSWSEGKGVRPCFEQSGFFSYVGHRT